MKNKDERYLPPETSCSNYNKDLFKKHLYYLNSIIPLEKKLYLTNLSLTSFRNIEKADLSPHKRLNLLYGNNGQGKTSFLEAINVLSLGRSFRNRRLSPLIKHEASSFNLFAKIKKRDNVQTTPIGVQTTRQGKTELRLDGYTPNSVIELASFLPIQVLNLESYRLLHAGPQKRRQFLDFIVFHVKQDFYEVWHRYRRVLKQRNAALKAHVPQRQVALWNEELSDAGTLIHGMREEILRDWLPFAEKLLNEFFCGIDIEIAYYRGWKENIRLLSLLETEFTRDQRLGYTYCGPQRADLLIRANGCPAHEFLSTGQQKLLLCALSLAHGLLMQAQTQKRCIYLIDDLPAELDRAAKQKLSTIMTALEAQIFVTSVTREDVEDLFISNNAQMFHVKHGQVDS